MRGKRGRGGRATRESMNVHVMHTRGTHHVQVKRDGKPCWQNKIRGLFCSHMCKYAIDRIRAGGTVDLKVIGRSCLARHRESTETLTGDTVLPLHEPDDSLHAADATVKHAGSRRKIPECIDELLPSLKKLLKRVGKDGIANLHSLVKLRLLGGTPGKEAYTIVDNFLNTTVMEFPGQTLSAKPRNKYR